jgi:hypothetical protein
MLQTLYTRLITETSIFLLMGIKDWFKRPEPTPIPTFAETEALTEKELAEVYSESFEHGVSEAIDLLDGEEEELVEPEVESPAEEYDVGDIEADALLDDEMSSNFEVNVVEHVDINKLESPLEDAEIVGDISQEVDM